MEISLDPGTYVVAVSGGVDSMALLHILLQRRQVHDASAYKFIVAHLDHGIRSESAEDRRLVQAFAATNHLPFIYHEANLGSAASEDVARRARYEFLHKVREVSGARAIITAHHADDVLETAVHNIFRGTGRKGLSSLQGTNYIYRPLLHVSKAALKTYAKKHDLSWHEDHTNTDTTIARNYIRHEVLPKLSDEQRQGLVGHLQKIQRLNGEIDQLLATHLHLQPAINKLDRRLFIMLPHVVAREVMAAWLRNNGIRGFDRKLLEQLVVAAKTLPVGKFISVTSLHQVQVQASELALVNSDR